MILLIEDDDTTRELTATVLRCAGHAVHTAPNGQAALAALDGIMPTVIFCDLDMPQLDGWAFRRLQLASDRLRHIPFVIVSAVISPEDEQPGLDATTALRKPVDPEELLQCARRFDPPALTAS